MGKRGPQKTPTAILARRGSWRAAGRKSEPKAGGHLAPPKILTDPRAVELFESAAVELHGMKMGARIDSAALARWAELTVEWWTLTAIIHEDGIIEENETDSGVSRRIRPEFRSRQMCGEALSRLERDFGFTPGARASLVVENGDDGEEKGAAKLIRVV